MKAGSHLALKASATNPEAFVPFYERHFDDVLAFLARRTGDADAALDLAAETFAQAFLSRSRFKGTTEREAAAWLFRIARRQFARYVRRGKAHRRALERLNLERPELTPSREQAIIELAGLDELRKQISTELERLSPDMQSALYLRIVDGLPFSEVAARLNLSEVAARKRVSRALSALCIAVNSESTPSREDIKLRISEEAFN